MSAFMVDREVIQYLVTAMTAQSITAGEFSFRRPGQKYWQVVRAGNRELLTGVGQALWDENRKNIEYLYPDCVGRPENLPGRHGETYVYAHSRSFPGPIDPVQLLKTCNMFGYQCCDRKQWGASLAKAIIDALKECAIRALPGYDEARWGAPAVKA